VTITACRHARQDDGACLDCGACLHEVILNRACLRCGAIDPPVTNKPSATTQPIVPLERLRRR
jgi:hypothetical protein